MIKVFQFRKEVRSAARSKFRDGLISQFEFDHVMGLKLRDYSKVIAGLPKEGLPEIIASISKFVRENWADILRVILSLAVLLDTDE